MELTINWTPLAKEKVKDIYDYYKLKANIKVAKKLVDGIIDKTDILIKSPKIGQNEPLLSDRKVEYRYLVFKNYKIIYWIYSENNSIEISNVFDTRQNPIKMRLEEK